MSELLQPRTAHRLNILLAIGPRRGLTRYLVEVETRGTARCEVGGCVCYFGS